jgi:hypothetical protein
VAHPAAPGGVGVDRDPPRAIARPRRACGGGPGGWVGSSAASRGASSAYRAAKRPSTIAARIVAISST